MNSTLWNPRLPSFLRKIFARWSPPPIRMRQLVLQTYEDIRFVFSCFQYRLKALLIAPSVTLGLITQLNW